MKVTQCNSVFAWKQYSPHQCFSHAQWRIFTAFLTSRSLHLFERQRKVLNFYWNSMRSCKTAVLPKAANRILDYLLLNSNSNTSTSVTKLPAFLNSHFYLSHHLRSPSAVYLKYIQLSSIFLWDVHKSILVGLCFSFCFISGLFI